MDELSVIKKHLKLNNKALSIIDEIFSYKAKDDSFVCQSDLTFLDFINGGVIYCGQGYLLIAIGLALGNRTKKVYCLITEYDDLVWEGLEIIKRNKIKNLRLYANNIHSGELLKELMHYPVRIYLTKNG